jgi:hypothetical protein
MAREIRKHCARGKRETREREREGENASAETEEESTRRAVAFACIPGGQAANG